MDHIHLSWLLTSVQVKQVSAIILALAASFCWDTQFSPGNLNDYLPGYGALLIEAVSSAALEHTERVLSPSLGQPVSAAFSMLGACVFSLPLYMLRHILVSEWGFVFSLDESYISSSWVTQAIAYQASLRSQSFPA